MREENGEIKVQLDSKKNDSEKERSPKNSKKGEKSLRKARKIKIKAPEGLTRKPRSRRKIRTAKFLTQ